MRVRDCVIIGSLLLVATTACRDRTTVTTGAALPTRTVADLVSRHVTAVGGEETLRTLRSWRLLGRIDGLSGRQGFIETSAKSPGRVRVASVIGKADTTLIFDGQSGWNRQNGTTTRVPDDRVERLRARGFLDDLLACRIAPECRMTLRAPEAIGTDLCYAINVAWPHRYRATVYLNPRTFLITRTVTEVRAANAKRTPVTVETSPSDYRKVAGITVPFAIRIAGEYGTYTVAVEAFEANVDIDDAMFSVARPSAP